ncbi:hypothetical protein SAMN05444411_1164 [Lutibacter oricola]|uniref:Lipoprotein n=1 Tax=Lutibacter oricola TaxID=762486 RepID=A0A1H3GRB3_9FLAO|nr:hypothetical protein [Lutibacter oricola]SDY05505.1 hypothetical protein SAMN05444411_1164 [Lutibacter oricola]
MKKNITLKILVLLILILNNSCNKDNIDPKRVNILKKFNKVNKQIFELDTIEFKQIIGEKGTKIYFNRELFDIKENDRITFELKEFYDFEDLVFNDLRTITHKNEILKSKGVIYADFFVNNERVNLKKGKKIRIDFPDNKLENNDIYLGKIDSLNQISWIEQKRDSLCEVVLYIGGGISKRITTTTDSIKYYEKQNKLILRKEKIFRENNKRLNSSILTAKIGWINIDKIIDKLDKVSFKIELVEKEFDNLQIVCLFDNSFSFKTFYRTKDNLNFKDLPYIKDITSIVVFGFENENIFCDKIYIKNNVNSEFKVDLKKANEKEIIELLKK